MSNLGNLSVNLHKNVRYCPQSGVLAGQQRWYGHGSLGVPPSFTCSRAFPVEMGKKKEGHEGFSAYPGCFAAQLSNSMPPVRSFRCWCQCPGSTISVENMSVPIFFSETPPFPLCTPSLTCSRDSQLAKLAASKTQVAELIAELALFQAKEAAERMALRKR